MGHFLFMHSLVYGFLFNFTLISLDYCLPTWRQQKTAGGITPTPPYHLVFLIVFPTLILHSPSSPREVVGLSESWLERFKQEAQRYTVRLCGFKLLPSS